MGCDNSQPWSRPGWEVPVFSHLTMGQALQPCLPLLNKYNLNSGVGPVVLLSGTHLQITHMPTTRNRSTILYRPLPPNCLGDLWGKGRGSAHLLSQPQDWLTCIQDNMVNSRVLPRKGIETRFSRAELVMATASPLTLVTPGPGFSPADGKGWGEGVLTKPCHVWHMRVGNTPSLTPFGNTHLSPCTMESAPVCFPDGAQSSHSCVLHPVRTRADSPTHRDRSLICCRWKWVGDKRKEDF